MKLELRKFTKFVDKTFIEGGKEAKNPVLLVSVAAVYLSIYEPFATLALFNNSNATTIPKIPNKGLGKTKNDRLTRASRY